MKKKRAFIHVSAFLLFLSMAGRVDAVIYELGGMGPKSVGMVGSVVATADDPIDALFFNPAAIDRLEGTNITAGAGMLSFPVEYKSPGGYKDKNDLTSVIPFFSYTTDRFCPALIGVGIYSNFGTGFEFEKDPSHGVYGDLKSLIGTLSLNPTVAYRIGRRLVLAVQGNISYGKAEIDFPVAIKALRTKSDGPGFGVTFGLLYKPITPISIGLKWRSPLQFTLRGDATLSDNKDDLRLHLYYPQAVSIGLGYMPTNNLTLELDYTWYDWSHFHHSHFSYDTWDFLDAPVSGGMKDCFRLSIGVEYCLRDNIILRSGYLYNRAATREDWLSPIGPDVTNHGLGLGGGIELGALEIDASLTYGYIPDERVSPAESRSGFPGKYTGRFCYFAVGITCKL
ncbi:MAG: outer membrane protein transport protein [Thermodesulfobacteriota bacterium]|nr:outer membrane protein transport protein [Thermodesulfobacteriota bacterium]